MSQIEFSRFCCGVYELMIFFLALFRWFDETTTILFRKILLCSDYFLFWLFVLGLEENLEISLSVILKFDWIKSIHSL